jgi:hypothetical protein
MKSKIYIKTPKDSGFELIGRTYEARSTVDFCKRTGAIMDHINRYSGLLKSEKLLESIKRVAGPKADDISTEPFGKDCLLAFIDAGDIHDVKLAHSNKEGWFSVNGASIAANVIDSEYINR